MPSPAAERLQQERDLYRRCLELGATSRPEPMLADAVELLREVTSAESGFIELREVDAEQERLWAADIGVDEAQRELIRTRVSRGVIAEAIETGETVHTPSALLDERFSGRESVRRTSIQAVLCVPLRADGVVGVVYLQNRVGGGPFGDDDIACVETVARFVSEIGARVLAMLRQAEQSDATAGIRQDLNIDAVVGRSAPLAELLQRLGVVATMDGNVLFTGASGTGKSLFARALHENSRRRTGPFVQLNCAALPENLVESELFGAARGAHSGVATQSTPGKVAAAQGGTLFLDEIGELPMAVQAKLLQLLQDKTYYRLGGADLLKADVRIVAATNRDLQDAISNREFREDLYYRVRSVRLRVPSLSERRDDIVPLTEHFCAETCRRNDLARMQPSPGALSALMHEDWPGNVRELASRCEEAVVNARLDGVTQIESRHFFPGARTDEPTAETFQTARATWERTFLQSMLQQRDWNVAQTARELDMSRSHLNGLIRRYDLRRSE